MLQGVSVTNLDVARLDTAHNEVHAGQVVRIGLELLGIVLDRVGVARVSCHRLAYVDKKGARTAGRVVDLDVVLTAQVMRHDLRHKHRHLVRRVELPRLFARIGGKHADEVLVDEAKGVVTLAAVHGDVVDEVCEVANSLGARSIGIAQLGKARLERREHAVEDVFMALVHMALECRKRPSHIADTQIFALVDPRGEEILVGDEVPHVGGYPLTGLEVLLGQRGHIVVGKVLLAEESLLIL